MVGWSKTADEGIIAENSFCEWIVTMNTLQKESFLCQTSRTFAWNWKVCREMNYLRQLYDESETIKTVEKNRSFRYKLLASLSSEIETLIINDSAWCLDLSPGAWHLI